MSGKDAQETSADRWSSWRRGVTVTVTPADTRLYRVVTCDAERIIGLSVEQLALLGTRSSATQAADDLLAYLDRTGYLRAREYRLFEGKSGYWTAEPTGQLALLARDTICIEPLDPETHLERIAYAA
jgi:hypothetical protein